MENVRLQLRPADLFKQETWDAPSTVGKSGASQEGTRPYPLQHGLPPLERTTGTIMAAGRLLPESTNLVRFTMTHQHNTKSPI